MPYFNTAFLEFFQELAQNNHKSWFDENRKVYEKEVKKPFAAFVQEMIDRIHEHEPDVQIKPSEAIMRINRDIRFSKEKIPYNTHVGANISRYGKKDKSYPGFFFQLSPDGIQIFGGVYRVETAKLQGIRSYIADHLTDFTGAYNDPAFQTAFGQLNGEQNKRLPKEFQEIAVKEPLIANKQFFYSAQLKSDLILSDELPDKLMEYYMAAKGVNFFLQKAWGNG